MQLDLFAAHPTAASEDGKAATRQEATSRPTEVEAQSAGDLPPAFQPPAPKIANLAELLMLFEVGTLTHHRQQKIRSALRGVGEVMGLPLDQLPADIAQLRPRLLAALPSMVGKSRKRWAEIRSDLYLALRVAGETIVSLRDDPPLTPAWAALSALAERRVQIAVAKFMRFCVRKGLEPADIDAGAFAAFLEELETQSLHDRPRHAYRQMLKYWNKASRTVPGWPRLVMPADIDPRQYALPWEMFPESLVEEVEAFLESRNAGDEFADSYAPPVRPITTKARRAQLRRIISALIHSGVPVSELTSLAVICQAEHVRTVLRFMRDRQATPATTEGQMSHGTLLKTIARHWLEDEAAARAIRKILAPKEKELKARRSGMRPKNRMRLRQFDDQRSMEALMTLPMLTLRRASRNEKPSRHDALKVLYALVIAIVMQAPVRVRSLAELELGDNILDYGKGSRRRVRVVLPEAKTKTSRPYEAPLPQHIWPLLDAWTTTYRPLVCKFRSSYVFPNSKGRQRGPDGLARATCGFIERETGITMNIHLFRHLTAKVILEHDPNAMEAVRQLLHHTSTRTTEKAYAELKSDPAFAKLDATYDALRAMPKRGPRGPKTPSGPLRPRR